MSRVEGVSSVVTPAIAPLPEGDGRIVRKIGLIIALLTFCRLLLAASTDFTEDEAYYWLWSTHLAAGYYDHPPMVAYWIKAGTSLFGQTTFGARFFFVGGIAAASYWLYRASFSLSGSAATAALVALWFNATLFANAFAIIATPDTPLLVMTCAAVFALAKLIETQKGVWWLGVGAALGAAFVSKYTAALLLPGLFLWMIATRKGRRWFASPYLYLGGVLALAVIAPLVYWNFTHDWASFAKQIEHGVKDKPTNAVLSMAEYLGGQAGIVSPLIFGFCLFGGGFALLRGFRRSDARLLMPSLFVAPAFVFFLAHSLSQKIQANWPGFLYASAILAAVHGTLLYRDEKKAGPWLGSLFRLAPALGLVITLTTFLQLGLSALPLPRKLDLTLRLKGWADLGHMADELRKQAGADVILTDRYALTGELAFYTKRPESVIQINQRIRYMDFPPPDETRLQAAPALLIVKAGQDISETAHFFTESRVITKLKRNAGLNAKDIYDVYVLSGYRGGLFAPAVAQN